MTKSSTNQVILCERCSTLLTIIGLQQAQTPEGFALRPVSEFDAKNRADGVQGNRCWMCIRIQSWLWPRLISPLRQGFPEPWTRPGAWVQVWCNSLERDPGDTNLNGVGPFTFLSVKSLQTVVGAGGRAPEETGFLCFARNDDLAGRMVPSRPLDVAYDQNRPLVSRMKNTLGLCLRDHTSCGEASDPLLPRRVIDVGSDPDNSERVHLHNTAPLQTAQYACLSYCWGDTQQLTITSQNETNLTKEIVMDQLGRTIQDAITMTRRLGLRYLWVDALCILQDSPEDKATEIQKMAATYGNATVTLAIGDAESANEGFLSYFPDTPSTDTIHPMQPIKHQLPTELGTIELLPIDNGASLQDADINPSRADLTSFYPLEKRGWAFQEFLLSPRIIFIIKDNIYWVCKMWRYQPLYWPLPFRYLHSNCYLHLSEIVRQGKDMPLPAFHRSWGRLFNDYASCDLSDPEDRLNALAGVISVIEMAREEKCLFGHWLSLMPSSLAWRRSHRGLGRACSAVPTWSWAAWDAVEWFPEMYEQFKPYAKVLGVDHEGTLELRARRVIRRGLQDDLDVDDYALWQDRHTWLRLILGIQVVKRAERDGESVELVALLLEKNQAGERTCCRRGVVFASFKKDDRSKLEEFIIEGKEETFYVR